MMTSSKSLLSKDAEINKSRQSAADDFPRWDRESTGQLFSGVHRIIVLYALQTRMHSSRIHIARCSGRLGGGDLPGRISVRGGVCPGDVFPGGLPGGSVSA